MVLSLERSRREVAENAIVAAGAYLGCECQTTAIAETARSLGAEDLSLSTRQGLTK